MVKLASNGTNTEKDVHQFRLEKEKKERTGFVFLGDGGELLYLSQPHSVRAPWISFGDVIAEEKKASCTKLRKEELTFSAAC